MTFIIESKRHGKVEVDVDDRDTEAVITHTWHVLATPKRKTFYAGTHINGKTIYLHKFLTTYRRVDHINGNGLDCRRSNMRDATHAQNMQNRKNQENNTSGYKGVYFHRQNKKWVVQIWREGQKYYIGSYEFKERAAEEYNRAAVKYHGEFAVLNEVTICK